MGSCKNLLLFCLMVSTFSANEANTSNVSQKRMLLKKKTLIGLSAPTSNVKIEPLELALFYGYYGPVFLGTPEQNLNLTFATGNSCLYVNSVKCSCKPCASKGHDYSLSNTHHGSRDLVPGDSSISLPDGYISTDRVQIGGVELQDFAFTEMSCSRFEDYPFQGVLGLGSSDKCEGVKSVLQSMLEQRAILQRIYSVWFNRSSYEGEIIFGGTDSTRFSGDITFSPNLDQKGWSVKLDSINVGVKQNGTELDLCSTGCQATIAPDAQLIMGPVDEIAKFNQLISADETSGLKEVNCSNIDNFPTLNFRVGGRSFKVLGKDYVIKMSFGNADPVCFSALLEGSDAGKWILGTPFLETVYTVFDIENKQVGFAESVQDI